MKAVFITTEPNDVANVIAAWDFWNEPSTRITFDWKHPVDDAGIIARTDAENPDVIFYIGGAGGPLHLPSFETFCTLREIAPSIHMIFDGCEREWHRWIDKYRALECFNLQVTIDGRRDSPADFATLAPVNTPVFVGEVKRDIPCGISGNLGTTDQRSKIINPLIKMGFLKFRRRDVVGDGFSDHVDFMKRCQVIMNTAYTGSGRTFHVKQRVLETGFAGALLLEDAASPTKDWIPENLYVQYVDAQDAARVIQGLVGQKINTRRLAYQDYVATHYTPQQIYGQMLDAL